MRKRGYGLIRKTVRWLHRRKGVVDIKIPSDLEKERITRFILQGNSTVRNSDGAFIGVGDYDEESGKYKIGLHIHGKNYLGGNEFAQIHLSKGMSTTTKPTLSETQYTFTPDLGTGGIPIIDKSIIRFKENTAYTLAFTVKYSTATKPRDLKMTFKYTDGTSYTPTKDKYTKQFTECVSTDPTKTIDMIVSYIGDRQPTGFVLADFGIYEGTYATHAEAHESYIGQRMSILIDSPLYSIGTARDEIDLFSGELTRKICIEKISEKSDISETDTEGVYLISLNKKARIGSAQFSPYGDLTEDSEAGIHISDDGMSIIFKPGAQISNLDALYSYLAANSFDIAYVLNEPTKETLNFSAPETIGKTTIDIFSEIAPKRCIIEYY